MKAHESLDERITGARAGGLGSDGPRAASSAEMLTKPAVAGANASGKGAQSPTMRANYGCSTSLIAEAWATLTKNPQDRSIAVSELVQQLGGRLVGLYYCFGEYDAVVFVEAPDDTTALALVLAAISPGSIKTVKTTRLFTVEETMEAMRKAGRVTYQSPSKG